MDATQLAEKMLEWGKRSAEIKALEAEIEEAVLRIGKTQVVGRVRARYSGGRSNYDYETPCANVDPKIKAAHAIARRETDWAAVTDAAYEVVERFTATVLDYDWREICKAAGIEPVVLSKTPPSVKLELEK